jgi:hypothetical protein
MHKNGPNSVISLGTQPALDEKLILGSFLNYFCSFLADERASPQTGGNAPYRLIYISPDLMIQQTLPSRIHQLGNICLRHLGELSQPKS